MVGHTGSIEATTKAVEVVDEYTKDVVEHSCSGGVAIVLADTNAEQMLSEDVKPHTAHTTNLVPIIITDKNLEVNTGSLGDVAPTMLGLLGVEQQLK